MTICDDCINPKKDLGQCTFNRVGDNEYCDYKRVDSDPVCQKCFINPVTMQNDTGEYLCLDCYSLDEPVEDLKTKRNRLIDEATKVAQEYAKSCEIGIERIRAFDTYEAVLHSTMEKRI